VAQKQKDIASLSQEKAREQAKFADLNKKSSSAAESLRRTTSVSIAKSKASEIERYEKEAANVAKKVAVVEEKIARKYKELHDKQAKLTREELREQEKRQRDHAQSMKNLSAGINFLAREQERTRFEVDRLKAMPQEITVLFLAANPVAQQHLRLDEEARLIHEKLRLSELRDAIKFETRWAVRPLDILQAINECRPAIIHFSGHGTQDGALVLQDANGREKLVSISAIVQTIKTASEDIRFMFFNSCFSKGQAAAAVEYIEGAIGMNASIGDDAARIFAAQFYSAIGFGKSVSVAFEQGKSALMIENIPEEGIPELFMQEDIDAELFVLVEPKQ
jgi:hypothetical protein